MTAQDAEDVAWDYGPDPMSEEYRRLTALDLRPLARLLEEAIRAEIERLNDVEAP